MDNKTRAEKMVQAILKGLGDDKSYYEYFFRQLDEAVREAKNETMRIIAADLNNSFDLGFAAAKEKALTISKCYHDWGQRRSPNAFRRWRLNRCL